MFLFESNGNCKLGARPCRLWAQWTVRPVMLMLACAMIGGCSGQRPPAGAHSPAITAQAAALAAVRRQPDDITARLQLAGRYAASGETFAAIEQLEVARELGDGDESLALRLAGLYDSMGEPEFASDVLADAARKPHASSALLLAS